MIRHLLLTSNKNSKRRSYHHLLKYGRLQHNTAAATTTTTDTSSTTTINRTPIASVAIASSLPFGACFAWSVLSVPLSTELGVISSLPSDWDPSSLLNIFSLNICGIGLTTAFLGQKIGEMGPKRSVQLGSLMWGGGLVLSSYAVSVHDITLLYLGYGVLGGMGIGFGYLGPLLYLQSWFPDRRGLAAGLAVAGFGGGSIAIAPVISKLLNTFKEVPTYLGPKEDFVSTINDAGERFVNIGGEITQVVNATASDVSSWTGLQEGLYLMNTGNTGVSSTLLTLAGLYSVCAFGFGSIYQDPPAMLLKNNDDGNNNNENNSYVPANVAWKTPQFWYIFSMVTAYSGGGWMILSCGKSMITDVFGTCRYRVIFFQSHSHSLLSQPNQLKTP